LELKQISKTFNDKANGMSVAVPVLADVSLHVKPGEFVSIVGPSGSGKSTLFHIIGGLVPPNSGEVRMDGREVTGAKGLISYMPQQPALFPWRTVAENAAVALEVAGVPKRDALQRAREGLAIVGLGGQEDAYPHTLSGGMQQRASFLRAMLAPQELMCLDEPFGALDALTRLDMQLWLLKLWEESRRSVLLVTHSIEEALFLSDRIYVLSNKPTVVLREIAVPFGRPRKEEMLTSPELVKLRGEIYDIMKKVTDDASHH
jgi:ABC-type nitrate/sulfonate/bicarbonate transport system ATPase subunit